MNINGYEILGDFSAENAGCSVWAYCRKDGHDFFIKKFTSVTYPVSNKLSPAILEKKRKKCDKFYKEKKEFYNHLSQCRTGNIINICDFFRYESSYYVITEREMRPFMDVKTVSALDSDRKLTLIKAVLNSFVTLSDKGVVHSDVKPANILVVQTVDNYCTGKVIDFDLGFHISNPPEEPGGDLVYLAPEALIRIKGGKSKINTKLDVFALALVFHEYWTGERIGIPSGYNYPCEVVADHKSLMFNSTIPPKLRELLEKMLICEPDTRISASKALELLKDISSDGLKNSDKKSKAPEIKKNNEVKNNTSDKEKKCGESIVSKIPVEEPKDSSSPISKLKIRMKGKKIECKEPSAEEMKENEFFHRPDDFD